MRAFIFSLDAFVAFTLALLAIYSLIFFSSIPSSYYYLLTQGHYLSRDVLMALSTTECTLEHYPCTTVGGSLLDNIVSQDNPGLKENLIKNTAGKMVPNQFGYVMEMSTDQGSSWQVLYDTGSSSSDSHAKTGKKLTVSSQVMTFGYSGTPNRPVNSTYDYLSCNGGGGIITCGVGGNTNPSAGGELVPYSDVSLVRIIVYI